MIRSKPLRSARLAALDPRLLIGVALVVASVAGVVAIVSATDETVDVLAARSPLAPGDRIDASDLATVPVRLDAATKLYLAPDDVPRAGLIVTRPVTQGELVPVAAIGTAESVRLSSIVLQVSGTLPGAVEAGTPIDVWAAPQLEGGRFGPPEVIAAAARVVRVVESDTLVGSGSSTAVEVLVPKGRVSRVLEAVANSDAVSIVPAAIPAG